MEKDEKQKARDDFWDLSRLVPRKARTVEPPPSPHLVSVSVPPLFGAAPASDGDRRLTGDPTASESYTYTPAQNPLLLSVTVRRNRGGYSFYEQFKRDAVRLFDCTGECVPYTPFFSYAPQYNQLSSEQLAYYLYLRSEIREGRYPRADKGYLFLLAFEIICLPEELLPRDKGGDLLAAIWGAYRTSVGGLDRYMIPWLTDYCLVFALPCPRLTPDCLSAAAEGEGVEFFFGNAGEGQEAGILRFLHLTSDYRFEASRVLTEGNRALFTRHIAGATAAVLPLLLRGGLIGKGDTPARLSRRAFSGTLCAHNIRAEYDLSYLSLRRGEGLRRTVGLSVKYAENRLRAAFGIRARLSTVGLPLALASAIDGYFSSVMGELLPKKEDPPPAYMKLYEARESGIDPASAALIEEASWALTRRLVGEEEPTRDASPPSPDPTPALIPPSPPAPHAPVRGAAAPQSDFLSVALGAFLLGGEAPLRAAEELAMPLPLMAERLNEEALLYLGDVITEPHDDTFALIEDYREEAEKWLKINTK